MNEITIYEIVICGICVVIGVVTCMVGFLLRHRGTDEPAGAGIQESIRIDSELADTIDNAKDINDELEKSIDGSRKTNEELADSVGRSGKIFEKIRSQKLDN